MLLVLLIDILHGEKRLLQGCRAVCNLAVRQGLARLDSIAVAHLPGADACLLGEKVDAGHERELRLADAEAAKRSCRRVVRVIAKAPDIRVLVGVGTDRMRAGTLEDRAAQACIGTYVEVRFAVESRQHAILVAAERERHIHAVALRMEVDRLLAREAALDGALEMRSCKSSKVLRRDILLASEADADEHGLDDDLLRHLVPAEHVGDFLARIVGTLVGAHDLDATLVREGDCALRLEECMLRERSMPSRRRTELPVYPFRTRFLSESFCYNSITLCLSNKLSVCFKPEELGRQIEEHLPCMQTTSNS